jgi:hypothetical protein
MEILIFRTNFQKSIIGWPQQPPTEKVLSSDFLGLGISVASMASTASVASMNSTAAFHKTNY